MGRALRPANGPYGGISRSLGRKIEFQATARAGRFAYRSISPPPANDPPCDGFPVDPRRRGARALRRGGDIVERVPPGSLRLVTRRPWLYSVSRTELIGAQQRLVAHWRAQATRWRDALRRRADTPRERRSTRLWRRVIRRGRRSRGWRPRWRPRGRRGLRTRIGVIARFVRRITLRAGKALWWSCNLLAYFDFLVAAMPSRVHSKRCRRSKCARALTA